VAIIMVTHLASTLFFQQSKGPEMPDLPTVDSLGGSLGGDRPGAAATAGSGRGAGRGPANPQQNFRPLWGKIEECELFVHYSLHQHPPPVEVARNDTLAYERGYTTLWRTHVWFTADSEPEAVNVTLAPLSAEVLSGEVLPYIHALLVKSSLLAEASQIPPEQVVRNSVPLVVKLRELDTNAGALNLFSAGAEEVALPTKNSSSNKIPYFKTKLEVRPVFDHTVHSAQSLSQGPFKKLTVYPNLGVYQPYLYVADFWLLEKDYVPLNGTLNDTNLNLTLTYSPASLWKWSMQAQMAEQWMTQGDWGLTDTQRDSFMLKRLLIDTNPYVLAFSGAFVLLHTLFSMLAFKNDVQFWRKNESMQGLSARSMCIAFACQLITGLYLLDSQETSRLILFEIFMDLSLAFWKLRKAIKIEVTPSFPFLSIGGQKGYDGGTAKYDDEAMRYMGIILTPFFLGYIIRSALYGKHRGWYSFAISAAAGGVYTFGFAMMCPQLYINYKMQSVEHLPWRALTYKAMNTFVDDVFAFLIDMPIMHRLSCFRDDIVFFVYVYQRWKYSVDKTRPSMWVEDAVAPEGAGSALGNGEGAATAAAEAAATDAAAAAGAAAPAEAAGAPDSVAAAASDGASADSSNEVAGGVRQRR